MSDDPIDEATPLAHEDAVGLLDALRDGELLPDEAARVEAHVAGCPRCRAVDEALGGGIRTALTRNIAEPDLLAGVQRRLRLRSRGRFYGDARKRQYPTWPLLVASAVVLVGLVVAYLLLSHVTFVGDR